MKKRAMTNIQYASTIYMSASIRTNSSMINKLLDELLN